MGDMDHYLQPPLQIRCQNGYQGMKKTEFDAVVIGSGPNGLAAAITLQRAGLSVLIVEGEKTTGGGLRSKALTLPGFVHDVCSAIHPLAAVSPFFNSLPLVRYDCSFIYPPTAAAHPFDDGTAALLKPSPEETAQSLGVDEKTYLRIIYSVLKKWSQIGADLLGPLHFPKHPQAMASFGWNALRTASHFTNKFDYFSAKGLWAGMAAHGMQPLNHRSTSAIALVLLATAHLQGWPVVQGGSQSIARALTAYFTDLGGKIETDFYVRSLQQLPSARAILFDTGPRQLLEIAGHRLSSLYKWQLQKFRYGMGVYKIDWALDAPVPFKSAACCQAGTVHIGNTFEEIASSEQATWEGSHPEQPFVILAQQSLFDTSRAPEGKHTAWAYCHVPRGSEIDMTERIERQVERFAPGFRDCILARHAMNTAQLEAYNGNYVGGDINGGVADLRQLFTRPALRFSPYRTSAKGLYICSASTPPGGGVHGMCGYHAARKVLKDIFNIKVP